MNYVDQSALQGMSIPYRACHGLLATGIECLSRANGIAKERGLDPALIAEITAAMALANAGRALLIALHHSGRTTGENNALGLA